MPISSILAAGILLLTFDDADYHGWLAHLPLFERYDAHATFFALGSYGTNEVACLKKLTEAGHTVGLHTIHHRDVPAALREEGWGTFWHTEVEPQRDALEKAGLTARFLAYPNNRHNDESDAILSAFKFERFRAGAKGCFRYGTNGASIVSIDTAFFPVAELKTRRVIGGTGVGRYYETDIDDICRGIRRAAERDEVFALFSHDISMTPGKVGMRSDWLEKLLQTAKACGVAVKGFGELGPVELPPTTEPMTVYLTFDDGCKDHLLIAAGELEKRGWRGFFCIVPDWIGREGKMTWDDVRELKRRGHVIVNHTHRHNCLGALCKSGKAEKARAEIREGAEILARELGEKPTILCLPGTNGDGEVTRMAREMGMTTMLVPRQCFGAWKLRVDETLDVYRLHGVRRVDFLVHGIRKGADGWMPFETKEDFIRYLDDIQKAEKAGQITVSADYALD